MILNESKSGVTYGVSHNEDGLLVDVNGERVLLDIEESRLLIDEMLLHIRDHEAGMWYNVPMKKIKIECFNKKKRYVG